MTLVSINIFENNRVATSPSTLITALLSQATVNSSVSNMMIDEMFLLYD